MDNTKTIKVRFAALLLFVVLIALYWAGLERQQTIEKTIVAAHYPELEEKAPLCTSPLIYELNHPETNETFYRVFSFGFGWGGPFICLTEVNCEKKISHIEVISHCETPSYMTKLEKKHFFEQFINMSTSAAFALNKDIDAVSGATISSTGFSDAIRKASHTISTLVFGEQIVSFSRTWTFGFKETAVILLLLITFLGSAFKLIKLRFIVLMTAMVIIGFFSNFPLSISHFSSILLGYIPHPMSNLLWWLLIGGALILIILSRKNLYCAWICPFGAVQELISKVSGFKLPVHPFITKHGTNVLHVLMFLSLGTMLYFRNAASGNYEPFAALFKFDAYGLIWIILPLLVFSAFFWKRFYCRFFCPVGGILVLITKLWNLTPGKTKRKKENVHRDTCKARQKKGILFLIVYLLTVSMLILHVIQEWIK